MIATSTGYVKVVDHMGDDLKVVNTARISFGKESHELSEGDIKLLSYLAKNKHYSPFRHCMVSFELEMDLATKNQFIKHQIGSEYQFKDQGWNECSRRYTSKDIDIYWPDVWREQSKDNKQASAGDITEEYRVNECDSAAFDAVSVCTHAYEKLLSLGVAREQARLFLPIGLKTKFVWTASLQAIQHFISLRDHEHAQKEIQEVAVAMKELTLPLFPHSLKALLGESK